MFLSIVERRRSLFNVCWDTTARKLRWQDYYGIKRWPPPIRQNQTQQGEARDVWKLVLELFLQEKDVKVAVNIC